MIIFFKKNKKKSSELFDDNHLIKQKFTQPWNDHMLRRIDLVKYDEQTQKRAKRHYKHNNRKSKDFEEIKNYVFFFRFHCLQSLKLIRKIIDACVDCFSSGFLTVSIYVYQRSDQ